MNRLNQLLVGLLVLQLAVVAFVFWPRPAAGGAGAPLFPGLEAEQIVALTIEDGQGQSIELARREGAWVLPRAGDYPVLPDKVDPLLLKIAGLKADRLVTETAGSHRRLQVAADEFNRRISFELADGTAQVLFLGSSPSFQATHVRASSQDRVYLTSDISDQGAAVAATNWVERIYFSVPAAEVTALILENANGTFRFLKDGEVWTMAGLEEGEAFDASTFDIVLSRATSVALLRPLGREGQASYGLDQPSAVVTVETAGGSRTLAVGTQDAEDMSYVVKSSDSPYYVRVNEFAVRDLVTRTRAEFLVEPAMPTPVPDAPEATATPASP